MSDKTQEALIERAKRDHNWDVEPMYTLRVNRPGNPDVLNVSASELEARLDESDLRKRLSVQRAVGFATGA